MRICRCGQLARRHGVHRRTVRQALADATPPPRKAPEREAGAFGPYEPGVRAWLTADLDAPRKQRHTARRVWQRLVEEHGADRPSPRCARWWPRLKVEVGLTGGGDGPADAPGGSRGRGRLRASSRPRSAGS